LAPLIRLFFSDLIASLQDHEPGEDEPGRGRALARDDHAR